MKRFHKLSLLILLLAMSGCILPDPSGGGGGLFPVPTGPIRVMIVQDQENHEPLSGSMVAAMNSAAVDSYCETHCVKDEQGVPEFKRYMKDTDTKLQSDMIQQALKRAVDDMTKANYRKPWLTISNGRSGYSGPVPETEAELLTLLKKYGGE